MTALAHSKKHAVAIILAIAIGISPPSVSAQTTEQARAFIEKIYAHYRNTNSLNAPGSSIADKTISTPSLLQLIHEEQKLLDGEVGYLNGDPFCDCQDYENLQVEQIAVAKTGKNSAQVKVRFTNLGSTGQLQYKLQWLNGHWLIDDITSFSSNPPSSLRAGLNESIAQHQPLSDTIEHILTAARTAIYKQKWQKANERLKQGLETLGNLYQDDQNTAIADDTGIKLIAAEEQEKMKALENAAKIRERILDIRLDLYKQKLGVIALGKKTIEEKYPDFHPDRMKLRLTAREGKWVVTYELPENVAGGTPVVEIDQASGKVVRSYRAQ